MTTSSEVLTVEHLDGVATLWLDNPRKRNAMGAAFWNDLPLEMAKLADDPLVRAVVLAGRGPMFSSGIDLEFLLAGAGTAGDAGDSRPPSAAVRADRTYRGLKRLQGAITSVAECPKPVIAAVHGWCIGAGVDLITACDIRLAAADARFSVRETRLAIVADVGTLQRLPRIVGPGHAAELALTAKDISADRALAIGLVNDVLEDQDSVVAAARDMASEMAALSPLAVQGTKAILRHAQDHRVADSLDYVALWNAAFAGSNDTAEAVAAFMEKRPPDFTGT
ncbi:MAG: crotonase/enoyl-CoA hydratase family protein [Actinobacteria bacterium]|nr:crotonase/enoyl-CoA hydratase family protein [Actinomycetota bacterium]MBW3650907.1 crotonase/enoyl-CoA hydratase family protein [Actinomycetota bacterium]